uniref:NADAR domain-containing protein n=1 Tax=Romanomermis culicivorax TaxID=13658 RepID=A0A915INZ5_ROMCU
LNERYTKYKNGATAKRIGDSLKWNDAVDGPWYNFAAEKLLEVNRYKYKQNKAQRMSLFQTAPKELVETSPYDRYWGIGLSHDHKNVTDRSKWGTNAFGKLLMKLRDDMMKEGKYVGEIKTMKITMSKNGKCSADNLSPENK